MHPVSFHSIAFSQQLSHMCFTPAKTIACLRYMMSQMILSNWKSHHISWKPWNHRQCEAADSEMIVLTLTHNDAALTHTENSKETFQYWGETHTHSLRKMGAQTKTRTLNHSKLTNEQEPSTFRPCCHLYVNEDTATPSSQPSLLRNLKDGANFRSD